MKRFKVLGLKFGRAKILGPRFFATFQAKPLKMDMASQKWAIFLGFHPFLGNILCFLVICIHIDYSWVEWVNLILTFIDRGFQKDCSSLIRIVVIYIYVPRGKVHHHVQAGARHHQSVGRVLHILPPQASKTLGKFCHLVFILVRNCWLDQTVCLCLYPFVYLKRAASGCLKLEVINKRIKTCFIQIIYNLYIIS